MRTAWRPRQAEGMNESAIRRIAATLTIGSFSIAALMGIAALLAGGSFGEGEARILLTTLIVGCASICMLCYIATAGTRWAMVGLAGGIAVVLPVATALVLVWSDWDDVPEGLLKTFGVGVVVAVTLAQICLLLGVAGARPGLRLVLTGTVVLAAVLAALISSLILGTIENDDIWRLLGVIAILDVLGTLVTIAMAKFGGGDDEAVPAGRLRVTLPEAPADGIRQLARSTGRAPEDLVAEAVDRYLHSSTGPTAP